MLAQLAQEAPAPVFVHLLTACMCMRARVCVRVYVPIPMRAPGVVESRQRSLEALRLCEVLLATIVEHVQVRVCGVPCCCSLLGTGWYVLPLRHP